MAVSTCLHHLPLPDAHALRCSAQRVIQAEAAAVAHLIDRLDEHFVAACYEILYCKGRVIVTGMGKSGHIAGKIAATLASTGTPAFFVHAGEASHGDLGMITCDDVVLALSNSGDSSEILAILPRLKRLGVPLIALTSNRNSMLAQQANMLIDTGATGEACPLGLAPTSSTTAALAMGDAFAVALLEARGFTPEDFAFSHPGGRIGRRLLIRVCDLMHSGADAPSVQQQAKVGDALLEMTAKKLGMTAVVDTHNRVLGIFTDGDLRRLLEKTATLRDIPIVEVMTRSCTMVGSDLLAVEAVRVMEEKRINALLVVDKENCLIGALNFHDVLQSGVM